jgi:hypothetical protein
VGKFRKQYLEQLKGNPHNKVLGCLTAPARTLTPNENPFVDFADEAFVLYENLILSTQISQYLIVNHNE